VLEIGLCLKTKHSVTESILANASTGGRSVEMHPGDDFGPRTALEFSKNIIITINRLAYLFI